MVIAKADKLLDLVQRSKLVSPERLEAFLAEFRASASAEQAEDSEFAIAKLIEGGLITRWQADRLREGRYKGFYLGKYKLLGHLGSGGMSSVYLAEHVVMQRLVAIKVLPQSRVEDSSYLARFRLEAQAAAKLDDRNIVRAYDIDNEDKIHFIVMEYIDGPDLQTYVKQNGVLPFELAAEYIAQAALGLEHAHEAGLIHRDIKPANLLVDSKGVVKVLDMGLAKFADSDKQSLTIAYDENVLGTADFLAPEQAMNSHNVDRRADIYSLGCTLYYLLTGHPPFPEGTLPQRLMAHQTKTPQSIFVDRPDAPSDLVAICQKMMSKSPDKRFQTAALVAEALRQWLAAHRTAPTKSTSPAAAPTGEKSSGGEASRPGNAAQMPARPGTPASKNSEGLAKDTIKSGSSSSKIVRRSTPGSGGIGGSKNKLRVAKPLDAVDLDLPMDGGPSSNWIAELEQAAGSSGLGPNFSGSNVPLVGDAAINAAMQMSLQRRNANAQTPVIVWWLIGGGIVLTIICVALVLLL